MKASQERKRIAIACQGGGSHTAFTAGVLKRLFEEPLVGHQVVGLSGTSGGAICALLAWYALREGDPPSAGRRLDAFWADNSATTPFEQMLNAATMWAPKERETEPMTVGDIADRRNELAGNLSLYQELHFIEKIDQMLEAGVLASDSKYKSIMVRVIELSRSRLPRSLGVTSKLNRDPAFIGDLIAYGQARADEFLTALSFEQAWRAADSSAVMSFFAAEVEFSSTQPFPDAPAKIGAEHVGSFLRRHLTGIVVDATRKQVAGDRVVWTLKARSGSTGSPTQGQAEMTLADGKITSLRLGPSARPK